MLEAEEQVGSSNIIIINIIIIIIYPHTINLEFTQKPLDTELVQIKYKIID